MPGIEFLLSAHGVIVLLALTASATLVFLYYRRTLPPVSTSRRLLLTALRTASWCTAVLLLFQPLLRLVLTSHESPAVAVLVDNSRSMRLEDRGGSRAAALRALLAGSALKAAGRGANMRYYTFGVATKEDPDLPGDTLSLSEDATDIGSALRTVAAEKERWNVRAVLLVSDGAYTLGENPVYDAERLGIPVYTVGVGDSAEQKDVAVTHIAANEIAVAGSRTPVDVTVRSSGFGGERANVELYDGNRELDRNTIVLGSGTREYSVHLSYVPEGSGEKRYSVRLPPLPEEITPANNQRSFTVRILKSSLHVLIFSGAPGPDLTMVRETLVEEPNTDVRSFTEQKSGGFYEGQIPRSFTDSVDCLVLVGMPTGGSSATTLGMVRRMLDDRAVPLLFIGGRAVDPGRLGLLGPAIPFSLAPAGTAEELVSVNAGPDQRGNPLVEPGPDVGLDAWSRLPPIYRLQGTYHARAEATVLARCILRNVPLQDPLLVSRSVSRQKSIAIAGYGIWRWRLMAQGDPAIEQLLPSFLHAAIRWLTSPPDARRFKVTPSRETFPRGEPAQFSAQVYGGTLQPLDDARIRLVAKTGSQIAETTMRSTGNGRYEGSLEGLGEGDYTFRATADWRGSVIEQDSGKFSVGSMDLEFRDTRMNVELLRQLAYRTGGRYFSPAETGVLDSTLRSQTSFAPREIRNPVDLELWHLRYLLAALLLLFAAEWTLRKWYGML